MADHLEALARRLEEDPFFLASPLKHFAQSEGLDENTLAGKLGCPVNSLVLLRLCRAPGPEQFKQDIDRIASRFGVDPDVLAEAVRRGQAILQLRKMRGNRGTLLAARDTEPPKQGGAS